MSKAIVLTLSFLLSLMVNAQYRTSHYVDMQAGSNFLMSYNGDAPLGKFSPWESDFGYSSKISYQFGTASLSEVLIGLDLTYLQIRSSYSSFANNLRTSLSEYICASISAGYQIHLSESLTFIPYFGATASQQFFTVVEDRNRPELGWSQKYDWFDEDYMLYGILIKAQFRYMLDKGANADWYALATITGNHLFNYDRFYQGDRFLPELTVGLGWRFGKYRRR